MYSKLFQVNSVKTIQFKIEQVIRIDISQKNIRNIQRTGKKMCDMADQERFSSLSPGDQMDLQITCSSIKINDTMDSKEERKYVAYTIQLSDRMWQPL